MSLKIVKQRRKTISITISVSGEIVVKAPVFLSNDKIIEYVNKKRNWIDKKLQNFTINNAKYNDVISKNNYLYLGKIIDNNVDFNNILKTLGKEYLSNRIYQLSSELNLNFNKLSFKYYKSRWGQCDKNNNITLNYKLACLDLELIDYVIVHELCHTKYFNHKKEFHNLLKSYFKNELNLRKRLKEFAFITKIKYD